MSSESEGLWGIVGHEKKRTGDVLMSEEKLNFLTTVGALQNLKVEPSNWIVQDLLRTGRRRVSLLAGKPECGKSTVARQLAVAVAKGEPFLGRATKRCPVLYWQSEEDVADLKESFDKLDYDAATDAPIYVLTGSAEQNTLKHLEDALDAHPEVGLVLIETLDDLLRITDIKENSAAREAFERFDLVIGKYVHRAAFVGLHHLKKRECDDKGEMLLGATVIRGRTDCKIYLDRPSDDTEQRIIFATVRRGRGIPKTYLEFNPHTETSTLGKTYTAVARDGFIANQQQLENDIVSFFAANPNSGFEQDCRGVVSGNSANKRKAFKRLLASGRLVKNGRGTKGNPAVYRVAQIPVEGTVQ